MLTCQQIINLACAEAKVPGMTQQAGQYLNARLVQIALTQDLDIVRRTTTITFIVGQASYSLPANYLRAREVFYSQNGQVFTPEMTSLENYDTLFKGPGEQDYPNLYATDIGQSPPLIYFYPSPSISTTATIRYMDSNVEITNPETSSTVPWFQDQRLLIKLVAEDLFDLADDTRSEAAGYKNDKQLRQLIQMANDKENRAIRVKKDPETFRYIRSVRPTKLQGD